MRKLLKSSDRRRLELIELLLEKDNWITISEVATQVNSSTRNLKEDISFLRSNYPDIGLETSQAGIRIMMDQSIGIQEFYRYILKDTLVFQVLEEIFFDETYTVTELAALLHTSNSTLYRAIDSLNVYFSPFGCQVETNPCRIIGDERFIRNYYRTYFKESTTVLEWPFRNYDEQRINANFNRILSLLTRDSHVEDGFLDFAFYESVKLMVMVSVHRYHLGHLVDTSKEESIIFYAIFKLLTTFVIPKDMKITLNQPMTSEYVYQVFYPYLKKDGAFGVKSLNKLRRKNEQVDHAITFLENDLAALSEKIDIEIDTTDLMVALYGTVYLEEDDPNGMYILYNRNKMFNKMMESHFPFVYKSLHKAVVQFRTLLKREDDEDKVNYLVYTLFTSWENLLLDLYRKYHDISVLILSDDHYSHAEMMKNLLRFELTQDIKVDTYNGRDLSLDKIKHSDFDLILTTFKLPPLPDKVCLVVDPYLTYYDINRIEIVIKDILETKRLESHAAYETH